MQNIGQNGIGAAKISGVGLSGLNGNNNNIYVSNNGQPTAIPDNFIFEEVDPSRDEDDSDSDNSSGLRGPYQQGLSNNGLKPGKKTKGRVKIKMEFIQNKLRRYTTFSKRKTGIMKKVGFTISIEDRSRNRSNLRLDSTLNMINKYTCFVSF